MKKYFFLVIGVVAFCSCQSAKDKQAKQIIDLEKQTMRQAQAISPQRADSLLTLYDNFIAAYPKDTLCARMLYNAADVAANTKDCNRALAYLDKLMAQYPTSQLAMVGLLKEGIVFEQVCSNKEMAKKKYQEYIQKYPKSKYANDAAIMLQMLDMGDDAAMIREFEAKNAKDSTSK